MKTYVLVAVAALSFSGCAVIGENFLKLDYLGTRLSSPKGIESSYFSAEPTMMYRPNNSERPDLRREGRLLDNALKNDIDFPLSFSGIFSRKSNGIVPRIDLSKNWQALGRDAVSIVNQYSYEDLKAAMKNQSPQMILGFNRAGNKVLNVLVCEDKGIRRSRGEFATDDGCRDILLKQSFDIEKASGGSLLSKMHAARRYAGILQNESGLFSSLASAKEHGVFAAHTELLNTTKMYMAMAVLFKAYEDANSVGNSDAKRNYSAGTYKEGMDKLVLPKLSIDTADDLSGWVFNIAAKPWLGNVSDVTASIQDGFSVRMCKTIPFTYDTISQLFDFKNRELHRVAPLNDITKGKTGTFVTDPLKFGAREFLLILSPERSAEGYSGVFLHGDAGGFEASCVAYWGDRLLEDSHFIQVTGLIPRSPTGTAYNGPGQVAVVRPYKLELGRRWDRLDKQEHGALTAFIKANFERLEKMRSAHKLR